MLAEIDTEQRIPSSEHAAKSRGTRLIASDSLRVSLIHSLVQACQGLVIALIEYQTHVTNR